MDVLDVGGRKALVIYSLANFLASQGAFQYPSYSATATVFYVGLTRRADGEVAVSGYRYLPTIHVDNDTRPAPIGPGELPEVPAGGIGQLIPQLPIVPGWAELIDTVGNDFL